MRFPRILLRAALIASCGAAACGGSSTTRPQPQPPGYGPYAGPPQGPQYGPQTYGPPMQGPPGYGPPGYGPPMQGPPMQGPPSYGPPPQGSPTYGPGPAPPMQGPPVAQRPMLPPLVGSAAFRAETQGILLELIARLPSLYQSKVIGIPLVFESNPAEINAYAGCDEKGHAFMAATDGILIAADAIAQTRATDELHGTRTYDAYTNAVLPQVVRSDTAVPALPAGVIPMQVLADPRRLSRAHELFDEIVAFTFAHELAHHYLTHTGCANGDRGSGPNPALLNQLATQLAPGLNQGNELASDNFGVVNVLETGKARTPNYRWTEGGGLALLDFFGRLSQAAGGNPLHPIALFRTHPNPAVRIPVVTTFANAWRSQNRT